MKHWLILSFLLCITSSYAQLKVSIDTTGKTKPYCYKDSVGYTARISGTDTAGVLYRWQKNGSDIPGADSNKIYFSKARPSDTGYYRCIASKAGVTDTSNTVRLRMHPAMRFDTLYRYNALACPGQCKAQYKAKVSGGTPFKLYPPYSYNWHGGHSQDTLCFGLCPGKRWLEVTDSMLCVLDTTYYVEVLVAPKIRYETLPGDTIFLTNPNATLVFNDTARKYMLNWKWYKNNVGNDSNFNIANVNPVTWTYDRTGNMVTSLKFRDVNGCDTTITDTLIVQIINLFIPNVMTSNPPNNVLTFKETVGEQNYRDIVLSEVYESNELWIYDRWGRRVYHTTNYVNGSWETGKLSDGTYFYVFKGHGPYGDDMHRGTIQLFK